MAHSLGNLSPNRNLFSSFSLSSKKHKAVSVKITNTLNEEKEGQAGKIKRLVVSQEGRTKLNLYPDRDFYAYPRFVTHVDDRFISTLTSLYRERLRPDSDILDLMSSWVSHLPKEVSYKRVVGHGLNAQELAKNPRLDYFFVKDLNQDQKLEFQNASFDAVVCTVSVQYLQQPEKVFAEVFRVLRPGGVFIVSFSNWMFYDKFLHITDEILLEITDGLDSVGKSVLVWQAPLVEVKIKLNEQIDASIITLGSFWYLIPKAISAWRDGTAYSRVQLVVQYFQSVEGFTQSEIVRKLPADQPQQNKSPIDWFMGLIGLLSGSDPFYAVLAYKNFKPVYD